MSGEPVRPAGGQSVTGTAQARARPGAAPVSRQDGFNEGVGASLEGRPKQAEEDDGGGHTGQGPALSGAAHGAGRTWKPSRHLEAGARQRERCCGRPRPGARLKSAPGFSLGRTEAGNMRRCYRSDHWAGRAGARLQADRGGDVPHAQAAVQRGREQPARVCGQRQVGDAVGVPAEAPHQARRLVVVPGREGRGLGRAGAAAGAGHLANQAGGGAPLQPLGPKPLRGRPCPFGSVVLDPHSNHPALEAAPLACLRAQGLWQVGGRGPGVGSGGTPAGRAHMRMTRSSAAAASSALPACWHTRVSGLPASSSARSRRACRPGRNQPVTDALCMHDALLHNLAGPLQCVLAGSQWAGRHRHRCLHGHCPAAHITTCQLCLSAAQLLKQANDTHTNVYISI